MSRSANAATSAREVSGDGRDRSGERDDDRDLATVADASRGEVVVEQERSLARRRWALERRIADADDRVALRERGEQLGEPGGSRHGVKFVAALREPGRAVEVVVRAERHDQEVGRVHSCAGRHASPHGIDCGDRLLQEAHSGLRDVPIGEADRVERGSPEHHVELRVPEHERVALVDQRDVGVVSERLRQRRGELETSEARPENDNPGAHPGDVSRGRPPLRSARAIRDSRARG